MGCAFAAARGCFLSTLVVLLLLAFFVYPMAFPEELEQPAFSLDPAEGKVWVNSEVRLEVRGSLSAAEVIRQLHFDPPVELSEEDITVEHVARLPLHNKLPWATTIVTVNPGRASLFEPDTRYELAIDKSVAEFETITLPEVTSVVADATPHGVLGNVPTTSGIVFTFNEEVKWHDSLLRLDPATPVSTSVEKIPEGRTSVRVAPVSRWENATTYTIGINGPVEDSYRHTGSLDFERQFRTQERPRIVALTPRGLSQPIESVVRVEFDRAVDRASVMSGFFIDPPIAGTFEWQSERAFIWRPQGLQHSYSYRISAGGIAVGGDTIVGANTEFRTHDPPVAVEIKGGQQAPVVLEAIPSGGLGAYWIRWSTGETARKILYNGQPDQLLPVEVTVGSGDRTATAVLPVTGLPFGSYIPLNCPEGWDLIEPSVCYRAEELPGPCAYVRHARGYEGPTLAGARGAGRHAARRDGDRYPALRCERRHRGGQRRLLLRIRRPPLHARPDG